MFATLILFTNCFFWGLRWDTVQSISIKSPMDPQTDLIISIIEQFSEWDFVIHLDNHLDLARLLLHKDNQNPLTIYNYNYTHPEEFKRPETQRCVHFVAYENTDFLYFTRHIRNINERDIIIFLTRVMPENSDFTHWYSSGVDNANTVFIVSRAVALSLFFYSAPEYIVYTQEVTKSENGTHELSKYTNSFDNMYGFPLKIGYTSCPPFTFDDDEHLVGVEYEIMKIVGAKLNITPILENYSDEMNPRFALIQAVNRSRLHFGIGCLSNNVMRNEMVSFSAALQVEPQITIYAAAEGRYGPSALYAIIGPLKMRVWFCTVAALVIMSILAKLLLVYDPDGNLYTSEVVLIPTQILAEQSTKIPKQSNSLRVGLLAWILVGFALSSSYKSKLTAALIMPNMNEPTTLTELLDQGYHFISPATDSTYLIEILQYSTNPTENKIGHVIEDTKVVCEAIDRAVVEYSAVIEERSVIRFKLWNYCFRNLTQSQIRSLRRLKQDTVVNGHVWAMQKRAPYKTTVSLTIEWLKSYGLIGKWYNVYNLSQPLVTANTRIRAVAVPLHLVDLVSAWIIIGFGVVVSGGAFLLEMFTRVTKKVTFRPCLVHTDSRTQLQPKSETLTET